MHQKLYNMFTAYFYNYNYRTHILYVPLIPPYVSSALSSLFSSLAWSHIPATEISSPANFLLTFQRSPRHPSLHYSHTSIAVILLQIKAHSIKPRSAQSYSCSMASATSAAASSPSISDRTKQQIVPGTRWTPPRCQCRRTDSRHLFHWIQIWINRTRVRIEALTWHMDWL
jgi:hypothetical protein